MPRLIWGDKPPMYDLGVDQGVLYLDGTGVPWNGLISVDEKEAGSVNVEHYFDGNRIHISQETGDFGATLSAYTYPDAFAEYNGYSDRQTYKRFGFSYRTQHGLEAFKIHLIYNVLVRDDTRSWMTVGAGLQPSTFNWDISGEAVPVPGASPSARLTLDSSSDPGAFARVEDILYGTDTTEPRLPDPAEIISLYEAVLAFRITYNDDGTYIVEGPEDMVSILADGRFELNAPSVFLHPSEDKFTARSI